MRFKISILYIFITSVCSAQTISSVHAGVPYDTITLKNNYELIFSKTDALRVIQLVGHAKDTIIMAESISSSEKAVGWLEADFDDYFVLYFTYDDDYTFMMHIFNKQNGKRIYTGTVIALDSINEVIFFKDLNMDNTLSLFDFKKDRIEKYMPPASPCLHWWYCIKKIAIADKSFTIEYTGNNNARLKKIYIRK